MKHAELLEHMESDGEVRIETMRLRARDLAEKLDQLEERFAIVVASARHVVHVAKSSTVEDLNEAIHKLDVVLVEPAGIVSAKLAKMVMAEPTGKR
jgi:hypothetical protein